MDGQKTTTKNGEPRIDADIDRHGPTPKICKVCSCVYQDKSWKEYHTKHHNWDYGFTIYLCPNTKYCRENEHSEYVIKTLVAMNSGLDEMWGA